jgi:hypothetical protein
MYNSSSKQLIDSPYFGINSYSNFTYALGSVYVDMDGILAFYVNFGDITDSWLGNCVIYSTVLKYPRNVLEDL